MAHQIDISEYNLCTEQVDMKEILDNFICRICDNVAIDARKCSTCSVVTCNLCKKDDGATCVKSDCDSTTKTKLNRIEQNILNSISFECHLEGCDEVVKYENYQKHINTCTHKILAPEIIEVVNVEELKALDINDSVQNALNP